jgi:multidrug efflux system outer membrane protein
MPAARSRSPTRGAAAASLRAPTCARPRPFSTRRAPTSPTAPPSSRRTATRCSCWSGAVDALLPASIESVEPLAGRASGGARLTHPAAPPDVVQAEFLLRAGQCPDRRRARAFFPTISLTALAGLASRTLTALFTGGAFNWQVSPNASLPIFDGGARRGNLAQARAQGERALADYELAIQTAFREVADALARRGTIGAQVQAQANLVAAARDNAFLANERYRGGIDSFLTSLDAQRTLYSAQQQLVTARLVRADNLVTLYRTLGGDALAEPEPARP